MSHSFPLLTATDLVSDNGDSVWSVHFDSLLIRIKSYMKWKPLLQITGFHFVFAQLWKNRVDWLSYQGMFVLWTYCQNKQTKVNPWQASLSHQFLLQRPLQFCQSLLQLLDGLQNNVDVFFVWWRLYLLVCMYLQNVSVWSWYWCFIKS